MSLIAAKLKRRAAAEVLVRQGRTQRTITDEALKSAIVRAYGLIEKMRELEPQVREARALIARRAGDFEDSGSTVSFECGGVRCTVTRRFEASVPAENVPALKKLLGRHFRRLVRERRTYSGTRDLLKEAPSGALGLLALKELSPRFRWEGANGDARDGGR